MTDLPAYLEEPLDEIDASVFSGDVLHNREAVERLEYFLQRWQKEIGVIKIMLLEREVEESNK